ncbi:uncharacterized protein LOC126854130 isoform X2 [Cataglyphis hispanica]|uniref:uncharacterized protein LOC126854130 isoform X2 n=1 Tax=Cataglyphis hispanica TaxID=1086592 RepID=UPI00217F2D08|nr:uncharacterized protein LOC126854130 isoform X2 [Cataglyphis hispanica]
MANSAEVTFEDFQTNERFKKLERSLKLAILKKTHSKSVNKKEMLPPAIASSSISSINVDSMNSSYVTPSLHTSVKSEVLASSNNLRNLCSTKRNCKTNREIMATSSVKQDDCNDRLVMPPPMKNTVYRISKQTQDNVPTLPNCKTVVSNPLNRSVQSSTVNTFSLSAASHISANTNTSKEYPYPFVAPTIAAIDPQRVNRSFSRWRVMLNDNYELIIKGTLECGRVAYSKPVIRRYNATCVESKYKYKYNLEGNIVDERNVLPDYIRGKFYNGFPDDWENVYQIWRTYLSQGCPVTFRWPTPITDSDDDLKSELTELTYICTKNEKDIFKEPCESFKYSSNKFGNPSENDQMKSSKKKRKYNCSTHSFQNCKENTSLVKPLISQKDIIPIVQTKNMKSTCDMDNEQNTELNVNPVYSFRGMNKLKDIIHEDKLKIIIDNLADRNCSPKYIDKVIELFNCLDYTEYYRTKSECDYNSAISANHETSCKQEMLQANLACDNNHTDNKFENELKEKGKNYRNSINLRDRSINNDSNLTQLSNPINVKPKYDGNNDSDESESLTYVGVPKISIERVLHSRKASRKIYKHKIRKKSANSRNIKGIEYEFESAPTMIPMANKMAKKSLLSDESCISITEDQVQDEIDMAKYHKIKNIAQRSQEDSFNSHLMRNNFDVYDTNNPAIQNKQSFNPFQTQKINLNASIKEQEISHKVEKNAHSQFIADIDYASNSDIDVEIISTSTRKTDENMVALHSNLDQDIVISSESNNNFSKKPFIFQASHREYIGQSKNEIAMKKSKTNITSLKPVNLKLKIKEADSKSEQLQPLDVHIVETEKDKQYFNIQPLEEICKNKLVSKTSIATTKEIIANDSHSKTIEIEKANNKKKIYLTTNKKNESNINSTNLTNAATEQSKSNKLEIKNNSKVLSAWMPKVIYYAKSKSELGLIFEGKLLNELGHVMQRKFTTDIVLKRLSATLIETVNHEFYELVGCLNDNEHVIPKELVNQCRNGCPANIEQFCLTWKMLQNYKIQKISEKLNSTSMDLLNTSVSSRGRRIVPPLSYWTGERITVKDNNLVYNPGNSQESSLVSTTETSKEAIKETKKLSPKKTKKQEANSKNVSKEQKLFKSNEISNSSKNETLVIEKSQSSNKSYKTKAANNTKKSYKSHKSRKSRINGKRYVKQNLTFSLTDSSEKEQDVSPQKRMCTHLNKKTGTPSQYTMTLRKRQSKDIPQ